jgi:methylenetetrahydrofolate dehydrogenase (NADP+)/methenyltetrahydrofolate cyclohydrolase
LPAEIIDGTAIAQRIRDDVATGVAELKGRGITPGLTVVLVGDDAASAVYVGAKERASKAAGINGDTIRLPASTTQAELLALVDRLNDDGAVHGILVQSPLPKHIDPQAVYRRIDPAKDVDGFHPVNVGGVLIGDQTAFAPCTPAGVMVLLREAGVDLPGKDVVVLGRSTIVGKPMASLLLQSGADATVTVCHSKTTNLKAHVRGADVLIAAIGRPEMIPGDWIKPGAVVIDVGVNRVPDPTKKSGARLCGDVDFATAREVASRITPVPGGVGPMTIAMLLANTLRAARQSAGA